MLVQGAAQQTQQSSPSTVGSSTPASLPECDADHPDAGIEIFSETGVDLTEYVKLVRAKVQRAWYPLVGADLWMKRACAVVDFTIRPDGGVSTLTLARSSGDLQLDRAALSGIISAVAFPIFPGSSSKGLGCRFRFYYNAGSSGQPMSRPSLASNRMTAPDDEPIVRGKDIAPPVVAYSRNPEHVPVVLDRAAGQDGAAEKGRVVLAAVVTSKGDVASVKIVRGSGNGIDEYAMASVVMSKFKAATRDGNPVRTEVELAVDLR